MDMDKENINNEVALKMPKVTEKGEQIFSQNLDWSDEYFTFSFLLNLLEACSRKYKVSPHVCQGILSQIKFLLKNGSIKLDSEFRKTAASMISAIRLE